MSRTALTLVCGALLGVAALAAPWRESAASAAQPMDGRWDLTLERPGWQPQSCRAKLVLAKRGKVWSGSVTFRQLMNGGRLALQDVKIKGKKIEFLIPGLDYRLRGKLDGDGLAGACVGKGGWTWRAKPSEVVKADLFEKGLSFKGYFPRGDAKKLGLDVNALHTLVNEAEAADTDALLVLKDGKVVCERYFGREPGPIPTMSVTKFVTALAFGLLLEEGKIESLDAPVSTWFPEWEDGERAKVTLRHLLTHTSGITHAKLATELNGQDDRVAYVRRAKVSAAGAEWSYNNDATALLSGIAAAAAGKPLDEYADERLFDPLGIDTPRWNRDKAGSTVTYAELWLTSRGLARVGQLIVDGGVVAGKPRKKTVVKQETLDRLAAQSTDLAKTQGLLWFRVLDADDKLLGVRHDGWLGQHIVVYPEHGLVGVRLRHGKKGDGREYGLGSFPGLVLEAAGP